MQTDLSTKEQVWQFPLHFLQRPFSKALPLLQTEHYDKLEHYLHPPGHIALTPDKTKNPETSSGSIMHELLP